MKKPPSIFGLYRSFGGIAPTFFIFSGAFFVYLAFKVWQDPLAWPKDYHVVPATIIDFGIAQEEGDGIKSPIYFAFVSYKDAIDQERKNSVILPKELYSTSEVGQIVKVRIDSAKPDMLVLEPSADITSIVTLLAAGFFLILPSLRWASKISAHAVDINRAVKSNLRIGATLIGIEPIGYYEWSHQRHKLHWRTDDGVEARSHLIAHYYIRDYEIGKKLQLYRGKTKDWMYVRGRREGKGFWV